MSRLKYYEDFMTTFAEEIRDLKEFIENTVSIHVKASEKRISK